MVPEDPTSVVFMLPRYKRHWSAQATRWLVEFHRKEWKWALPFYLGVAALLARLR
jgi:hypothetical protein